MRWTIPAFLLLAALPGCLSEEETLTLRVLECGPSAQDVAVRLEGRSMAPDFRFEVRSDLGSAVWQNHTVRSGDYDVTATAGGAQAEMHLQVPNDVAGHTVEVMLDRGEVVLGSTVPLACPTR